ncbi:hypothetical protein K449DRAFT_433891 [Hypoxylon sp. EC38]|nr:hypothetical protein K449DRAFT_433891 [Hypoxylon sp. EC38]
MQPLTTIFTAPPWCLDRFAVYVDNNPFHSSTLSPSRGWADPSFSRCVPSQYTDRLQTLSPGVCPDYMTIARNLSHIDGAKTIWMGGCCQSGFSDMWGYFCTSSVTTPMGFLLLPNITTADIYTIMSNMWVEHDQITVAWQETDLDLFPEEVAAKYASIMGIAFTPTTIESSSTRTHTISASERTSNTIPTSTTLTTTLTVHPITDTITAESKTAPSVFVYIFQWEVSTFTTDSDPTVYMAGLPLGVSLGRQGYMAQ